MTISQEALEACAPLLHGFTEDMGVASAFRLDLFETIADQRSHYSETLRVLTHYQSDRGRGVYALLVNGLVWDAEIVLRSFYEVVAKTEFLVTCRGERREQLLTEFWNVLPSIYDAKDGDRAMVAEKFAARHERNDDARVFSFLRDEKHFNLKKTENRKYRQEVEQRWSFSKIVGTLAAGRDGHDRIIGMDAMLYGYGLASHVAHASPKAFDLLEDRSTRGDDLLALEVGHVDRMLSDMLYLTIYNLHQIQTVLIGSLPLPQVFIQIFKRATERSAPIKQAFHRSQDAFYDRDHAGVSDT